MKKVGRKYFASIIFNELNVHPEITLEDKVLEELMESFKSTFISLHETWKVGHQRSS